MSNSIAIFASSRRHGNTGQLIDRVAELLEIDVIDLADKDISPYDYDHRNINDDFIPVMERVVEYDRILFVTPIYWYGPSSQMKTFIDRTSDFLDLDQLKDMGRRLRGKNAYIVCTSISDDADQSFLNAMKDSFEYLGMTYGGYLHANCERGFQQTLYENDINRFVDLVQHAQ